MRLALLITLLVTPTVAQQSLQKQIRDIASAARESIRSLLVPGTPLNCNLDPKTPQMANHGGRDMAKAATAESID